MSLTRIRPFKVVTNSGNLSCEMSEGIAVFTDSFERSYDVSFRQLGNTFKRRAVTPTYITQDAALPRSQVKHFESEKAGRFLAHLYLVKPQVD